MLAQQVLAGFLLERAALSSLIGQIGPLLASMQVEARSALFCLARLFQTWSFDRVWRSGPGQIGCYLCIDAAFGSI